VVDFSGMKIISGNLNDPLLHWEIHRKVNKNPFEMNPLLLDSEKSHLSVDMLFVWFACL
jgi:hypothetical protein